MLKATDEANDEQLIPPTAPVSLSPSAPCCSLSHGAAVARSPKRPAHQTRPHSNKTLDIQRNKTMSHNVAKMKPRITGRTSVSPPPPPTAPLLRGKLVSSAVIGDARHSNVYRRSLPLPLPLPSPSPSPCRTAFPFAAGCGAVKNMRRAVLCRPSYVSPKFSHT